MALQLNDCSKHDAYTIVQLTRIKHKGKEANVISLPLAYLVKRRSSSFS